MDGHIVASFITALVIKGEQITAGIIKSKNGKWQLNLDGETFNLGDKLVFDGTNLTFGSTVALSWAQVSNKPIVLSADDIKNTVITKDYIASLKLLVGSEILMGSNAVISWANITDDAKSKLQVKFQYSTDNSSWHDTYASTDVYMHTSNDGGVTWGTGVTIKGADGVNGTNGVDGKDGSDAYVPEWVKVQSFQMDMWHLHYFKVIVFIHLQTTNLG